MLDLVAEVAGEQVKGAATFDVAGAEQLPDVPAGTGFVFDLRFGEVVGAFREMPAEDDGEGPDIADQISHDIGQQHIEKDLGQDVWRGPEHRDVAAEMDRDGHQQADQRPGDVVFARLPPHLAADVGEDRGGLAEAALAAHPLVDMVVVQGHGPLEQHHDEKNVNHLWQEQRVPFLKRRDAQHAVADIEILTHDIGPGVMHDVVRLHPGIGRAGVVPLPGAGVDTRVFHPVPLRVKHIVAELHVLEDFGHAEQERADAEQAEHDGLAGPGVLPERVKEQAGEDDHA